jgi:flagellar FliL protein
MSENPQGNVASQKQKKKGPSIFGIFKLIGQSLLYLVLFATVVSNLAIAYIVFAPDSFPKPFYMQYNTGPGGGTTTEPAQSAVVSEPVMVQQAQPETVPGTSEGVSQASEERGMLVDSGTKIVNLTDPGGRKFIRADVVIEFAINNPNYAKLAGEEKSAFDAEYKAELEKQLPLINDAVITLLSTKDFQSIYTEEGKSNLRREIKDALNARMPEYRVLNVYFTEFVMQ